MINASLGNRTVMVHFLYHLGWVLVPMYLVKHDSRCSYEVFFLMRLIFKLWIFNKADCPPYSEWASFKQ